MKTPRLLIPSLILAATLLGCGTVLAQVKTTPENLALAVEAGNLWEKAAKGDAAALAKLRALAEKGVASAQFNLEVMYRDGKGVAKDEVEAVKWFRKAADQGEAFAQFNLGTMYWVGNGVVKDKLEAYKWFLLSGAQGDELAKMKIPIVEKDLTASQRAEGQRLAREWKPKK